MTSIILAGGKSSRLVKNKALEVIEGKSLIQWVIDCLAIVSKHIIIATAHGEQLPWPGPAEITTVADIYPGKGPLGGIHSGLTAAATSSAIVVACDAPFLSVDLLKYLAQVSPGFDAVIPRIGGNIEPLCALYSRNCLAAIQKLLEQDERQIRKLFDMVKVRYVEEEEIDRFDPEHLSFFNINTREDLETARRLAAERGWAT